MADEINAGSANAGSPENLIQTDPAKSAIAGESAQAQPAQATTAEVVSKQQYEDLESKLGSQGQELGEYREFFKRIAPVLDKLESSPELVQAILDGKVDSSLAQAALEGKVSIGAAQEVTKAHEEVKKDLGTTGYAKATPEQVEELVNRKLDGVKSELRKEISDVEEMRSFENQTTAFIENTPDFADYAEPIQQWLEDHPDQDDIKIAYSAVKGEALQRMQAEANTAQAGEAAKEVAANAAGGASQGSTILPDKSVIDSLIAGRSNPNVF